MSRKAVQGYTEKSYYENIKFLGVVATNDPLQEGYFKHMVNFDISDTGQSVKPRKGWLTTSFLKTNTLLNLSQKTIMFKDNKIQKHIIYDFSNNRGYIADVSAYNVSEKLLPITHEIVNLDWADVVTHLKAKIPEIQAYSMGGATDEEVFSYIKQHLVIDKTQKPQYIIDMDGIKKFIYKIIIEDSVAGDDGIEIAPYEFILEIYYRETETIDYAADTLVFSIIDFDAHYTYVPTDRNIASRNSIIPKQENSYIVQNLYTEANRPAGHVNNLGLIYCKDALNKYYINSVYKNKAYTMHPHFDLGPASLSTGGSNSKWAYYFEIWSTYEGEPNELDLVYRSDWYKYINKTTQPTKVFPKLTGYDLDNADANLRHYENTRTMITLVPKTVTNNPCVLYIDNYTANGDNSFDNTEPLNYTAILNTYNAWKTQIESIESIRTLRAAIKAIEASGHPALFAINSFTEEDNVFLGADSYLDKDVYIKNEGSSYTDNFITAEELLEMIDQGVFSSFNFTFKLYPYAAAVDYTWETPLGHTLGPGVPLQEDRYYFRTIDFWGSYSTYDYLFVQYNLYEGIGIDYSFAWATSGDYELYVSTNILRDLPNMPSFVLDKFFQLGYIIKFYMIPYDEDDDNINTLNINEREILKLKWLAEAYSSELSVVYGFDDVSVTTIQEVQEYDPDNIQNSRNMIVYNDSRLVVWNSNCVYISQPGDYYYFKETDKLEFGEKILKVIQYKNILLAFSTQNLYAIYMEETEVSNTYSTTDENGNTTSQTSVGTVSTPYWASQCVLYNILVYEKYLDVIQVFNEHILFYSAEGQMYLIKPNTMIDDETRFSLKFFNIAANDILDNYDTYINERLTQYGITSRIEKVDVQIKALVSVNFIKLFFYVPGYITYVLVYDVVNNRYIVYDTLTFTEIRETLFIESGEAYLTEHNQSIYITFPYAESNLTDNNVDLSIINNFKKIGINCLIDTGNLSLNNHLRKRFLTLATTFKNISSKNVLFNIETMLDDIISHPYYDTQLEVRDIGGVSYFVTAPTSPNENDIIELVDINQVSDVASSAFLNAVKNNLFTDDNLLMDFSEYTSSKLITYKTSILGRGKVFRLKIQFVSKGVFKIQSFGIVYKERRV